MGLDQHRRGGRLDPLRTRRDEPVQFWAMGGIFAAAIAAVDAIWWMPFYPIWALTYLVIAVLVIYALAVYGGNAEERSTA
jgi:hypothetical protein